MNAVTLVTRLHQHRMWVNQRLLTAAESLNEEQLRQAFQMGQGSVWKSLLHLYAAEYVWLEALEGNPSPVLPGDRPTSYRGIRKLTGRSRIWLSSRTTGQRSTLAGSITLHTSATVSSMRWSRRRALEPARM
ncbi:MAG: DinB family protein [Planctomycetaceae bacterium]